jgi:hypothetical protein
MTARHHPSLAPALFLLAIFAAGISPLLRGKDTAASAAAPGFPGWPAMHEGRTLSELPLSKREEAFARDFPGRIGRFTDGEREIILRWVAEPTRRLHPASDCFRGSGYKTTPRNMKRDSSGRLMSCFSATRASETISVCEGVHGLDGQSWPDASSWYWDAILARSTGPWWSVVEARKALEESSPQAMTDASH